MRFLRCVAVLLLGALSFHSVQATPTFQAAGTAASGTGAVSPAWPAHLTDDVALLFIETGGNEVASFSNAQGFVEVTSSPQFTGTTAAGTRLTVYWARATSNAMPAPTISDAGDHVYAQIITYRNVIGTGNPWDVLVGGVKAATSTSLTVTGVTTTVADTLIVQAASRETDANGAQFSAQTNATLTSIAERSDAGTTSGNGGGFAVWDGKMAAVGATGSTTATLSTTAVNAFMTIALKPALLVVNTATLNGAATVTTTTGASITAAVNATVFSGSRWRSTGWRIAGTAPGAMTCVDHANHDAAGTYNETFTVTAPSTSGSFDVYFIGYTDDACSSNPSSALLLPSGVSILSLIEFNSSGGTTSTDGLHFYIEDTTKIQVRRLNNTGQVYAAGAVPPSNSLDNGIFIRANGLVYGPSHTVSTFTPTGGMYNTYSITAATPPNPSSSGVQQTANGSFGITAGPQVAVQWKYTTPLDFITADVTVTIPAGYTVSAGNPVRYYHVFDTFLGGSDNGRGIAFVDATTGKRLIGTYPPVLAGNACSPTTSIPAGASIVESFRERSGLTFSNYCVAGWNSFFTSGSPACSVLQAGAMDNTVISTYQDTGIGIELDFTAPGTYIFSYDFVIGSPNVPPYDHLEIQHDGSATLCPESINVLACTSSTVPCPAGNIVNTGTLTGSLTATPSSPTVTFNPASFSIGASPNTQTISLQAAGAGTVTLGSTGLTSGGSASVPLSGTKCWNTATSTASCSMTIAATPCVNGYECLETGATYNNLTTTPAARNPLYTKLSGTNFKFDVVAVQSTGAIASSYTAAANVTVELFADTASPTPACNAYSSPVASQAITFAAGDNGRKTLSTNINLPNAYTKLRCRVTDTNLSPTVYGCSSDDFAVRPAAFLVAQNTPNLNAGATFTMQASAVQSDLSSVTTAYTATPALNLAQVTGVPAFTTAALSPSVLPAATAGVSSATFTYDDVGTFTLPSTLPGTLGVSDSTFTTVDQVGDCVTGSASNTADASGKFGCLIGQSAAMSVGRFYPDHFDFTPVFAAGCPAGGTTYMDQPFSVGYTVTAKALARASPNPPGNTALKLYTGGKLNMAALNGATDLVARLLPAVVNPMSPTWTLGVASAAAANYTFARPTATAADATWGPFDALNIGVAVDDPDGRGYSTVTSYVATTPAACTLVSSTECRKYASLASGTTRMRYGRIQLQNAYGSEYLALPLPMAIQYWNANWVSNVLDTCTTIAASQFAWDFLPAGTPGRANNLAACNSALSVTGSAPNYTVSLTAPGATRSGWSGISLNLGSTASGNQCVAVGAASPVATTANVPWLQFPWAGGGRVNPTGRATFGVYKSPLIYRRENY
jgi:hypothetical protein